MLVEINSIKDARVEEARALTSASGRHTSNKCLLLGLEAVLWALRSRCRVLYCFTTGANQPSELAEAGIPCYKVTDGIIKKITDTTYVVPVVGVADVSSSHHLADSPHDFTVMMEDIQDPGNIGTIVRTAAAFGLRDFALSGRSADLFTRKAVEASRGLVFDVRQRTYSNGIDAVHHLKAQGYYVVATSPRGQRLQSTLELPSQPLALVLGNETHGVSDAVLDAADAVIQIPMLGVESLNVGVAAGISLYELTMKKVLAMLSEKIRNLLGRHFGVLHDLGRQAFNHELTRISDLTAEQAVLMMILHCDVQSSVEQAARDIGVGVSDLDVIVTPLVDKGLVDRDDETLSVTAKGQENLAKVWVAVERSEQQALEDFAPSERQELFRLLKRVENNLSKTSS